MGSGLILAIDQGTTNTKALLVDRSGSPVFRASSALGVCTSAHGFVEQDPVALWDSVHTVIAAAVEHARTARARIEAVAISNQRETATAWDAATGEPLACAISWQCCRSADVCRRLANYSDMFRATTGLPLAPLVSAGKWTWLLQNEPRVRRAKGSSTLRFGTVDSWLIHCLTKGATHVTDLTNASRTGLLNLAELAWDSELLDLFCIPATAMPHLKHSVGLFGTCTSDADLAGVPILAVSGDSHAAMFGHGRFAPGSIKATYGTGSSIMALTPTLVADTPSLSRTIAWSTNGNTRFALEGNIPMTGSAIQWLGEFLKCPDPSQSIAKLASSTTDARGIYFVPAMLGLGAPYWESGARGMIAGLGRYHTSAHLARAAVDAIAYQVADVLYAIEAASGIHCNELLVDGGATRNSLLMQFQADILRRPILRSRNEELSAIGVACLAGLGLGWWKSLSDLESIPRDADRFDPVMPQERRDQLYRGWKAAIACVRNAARTEP